MSTELTTLNNRQNGKTDLVPVSTELGSNQSRTQPKQISRNGLATLHKATNEVDASDLRDTAVGKGFQLASDGLKNSLSSGLKTLSIGSKGTIDALKKGGNNPNIKSIILGLVGSVFGLKTLQGMLGAPKRLSAKDAENKAPALFAVGKWIAGGSLAFGALKAFSTGAGLANPTLIVGLLAFMAFNLIISSYENDNSPISKILDMLGLRDKVKSLSDDLQTDKLFTN